MQSVKTFCSSTEQAISSCYQTQDSENKADTSKKLNRETLVSWLLLVGSLIFVLDGILENIRGVSFSSILHLSASVLFTVGSVLFIPNNSQQR